MTNGRKHSADLKLARASIAGDRRAREMLTRAIADTVWSACLLCAPSETEGETAFSETMDAIAADSYRRLEAFDGRHSLSSYVALVVREALAGRTLNLLVLDRDRGWKAIKHFFQRDICRIIRQKLPASLAQQAADDAYQSVCLGLVEDDFRRLRSFAGKGSFTGYVLHTVERLVIDYSRSLMSRRRLPAAVAQLGQIDQIVFRLVYWNGEDDRAPNFADAVALRHGAPVGAEEAAQALARVRRALPTGYDGNASAGVRMVALEDIEGTIAVTTADGPRTPETELLEREEDDLLSSAVGALQSACRGLSEAEVLFLRHLLAGLPPRKIAPLMGLAVTDINRLRQKVIRYLMQELGENPAIKNWLASVYVFAGSVARGKYETK